jgi:hypothetical protein
MAINVLHAQLPDTDLVSVGYRTILREVHDDPKFAIFGGNLTEDDLQRIITVNNTRYLDSGDMSALVIGHIDFDLPETERPPVVGFARNFRLTMFGAVNPTPAVEAEFLFYPAMIGLAKEYPRCSPELHIDGTVDPIALLGASTPHLDIGLMLSKDGKRQRVVLDDSESQPHSKDLVSKLAAAIPAAATEETAMDETQFAAMFTKCLEASPMGQYFAKKMAEETAATTPEETKTPPAAMADGGTGGGGGAPATHVPELGDDKANLAKLHAEQRIKLERDQLKTEVTQLRRMAEDSARRIRLSERSAVLLQLVNVDGYQFDAAAELEDVVDMDDAQWGKHVERIKKNYAKVTLGRVPVGATRLAAPDKGSEDLIQLSAKVKEYCFQHPGSQFGVVFADAQAGRLKL